MNKKLKIWQLRIPTIFAFLLLAVGVFVTIMVLRNNTNLQGRAAPDTVPKNVHITNVTDSSFTVSYTTSLKSVGSIVVKGGTDDVIIFDERDKSGEHQSFYSHQITTGRLKSNTEYIFSIISEGKTYDDIASYRVKTSSPVVQAPPSQNPIFGKIQFTDGTDGADTMVLMTSKETQPVSVVTNNKGEFIIPTNSIRTTTLSDYYAFKPDDIVTIQAFYRDETAQATVLFKNASSIPTITISNTYNFITPKIQEAATPSSQFVAQVFQEPAAGFTVVVPEQSQSFIDNRPTFRGTSAPNRDVTIVVSPNITLTAKADSKGVWTARPAKAFDPGTYNFSATGINPNTNSSQKIQRSFSVFTSGSQIGLVGTVTPTRTPTPRPTGTPTATPTKTPTPTITPTVVVSPSVTTTTTPSPSPSVTTTITPSVTTTITPTTTVSPTATPTVAPTATATPTATVAPTATTAPTVANTTATVAPRVTIAPSGNASTAAILTIVSILFIFTGAAILLIL